MKRAKLAAFLIAAVACALAPDLAAQAVPPIDSPLNRQLEKIFPEIASGYIDLNGNGKMDQSADLNEAIPESRMKDGQLHAQEILDFIVANWRFIPLDKLRAVQAAVKTTPGAINELIAIDFSASLDDAIAKRAAMGDSLYLTPSAYKEAMDKLGGLITAMTTAYKTEGAKGEADFVASRDELFGMMEKGYPLPKDIPDDERATLAAAMLNTAMKEQKSDPARVRTAIKTLGRLGAGQTGSGSALTGLELAAPYLANMADGGEGSDFQIEAVRAIGEMGYKPAVPSLSRLVKSAQSPDLRRAALEALGEIGGGDGIDAILDLLKPSSRSSLPRDFIESIAQALAGIAQKGNADSRVQAALRDLSGSDDAVVRRAATAGIGAFATPASSDALVAVLGADKDPAVRTQAVKALGKQKSDAITPALMKVLREKDLDPDLEIAVVDALGDTPTGSLAIAMIVDDLGDKSPGVRAASASALQKLYPANQPIVTSALTRSLLASQDESFLVDGTGLLAVLADPTSIPALLTLLQKPQPEVRANVAWAFYKIRSASNPRVVDEMEKLITNENEAITVRVNAVRAVGAIAFDSPQLNLWQTLVTTAQMRGDKYASLRSYAVWALGRIGAGKSQVIAPLARIASRDPDTELRKQAVSALRYIAAPDPGAIDALAASYSQTDDPELKVLVLEALADMGSDKPASLAGDLIAGKAPEALKLRALSALAESPDEASAAALLDASRDAQLQDFVESLLEGYPSSLMTSLVARRLRTETDKNAVSVLETLDARFSQ
jgi:HEAT repeat protein